MIVPWACLGSDPAFGEDLRHAQVIMSPAHAKTCQCMTWGSGLFPLKPWCGSAAAVRSVHQAIWSIGSNAHPHKSDLPPGLTLRLPRLPPTRTP